MSTNKMMSGTLVLALVLVAPVALWWVSQAGDLEPPGPPNSTMKTLDEVADVPQPDLCFDNVGRFVDCGDGTVKDNLTGLFWLKNANCFGTRNWAAASIAAAQLADGQCGLTDGSRPGDWRLPTLECPSGSSCTLANATGEFTSVFAPSCPAPFILNTYGGGCWSEGDPFSGVVSAGYWSSTTFASTPHEARYAYLGDGNVNTYNKSANSGVWPVRGGQ